MSRTQATVLTAALRADGAAADVPRANGSSAHEDAGSGVNGAAATRAQSGEVPTVQCSLPDVEALLGHLDRAPEPWRAATRSACEALHAAILEASFLSSSVCGWR